MTKNHEWHAALQRRASGISSSHCCARLLQGGQFCGEHPALRGLRARFPDAAIGFIGSEVTADFERAYRSWIGAAVGMNRVLVPVCACSRLSSNSASAMDRCSWRSTSMALTRSPAAWFPGWSRCMWRVAASAPIVAAICLGASTLVSVFWRIQIGTVLIFSSVMPVCSAAITSLNCFASWLGCRTMWIPQR